MRKKYREELKQIWNRLRRLEDRINNTERKMRYSYNTGKMVTIWTSADGPYDQPAWKNVDVTEMIGMILNHFGLEVEYTGAVRGYYKLVEKKDD